MKRLNLRELELIALGASVFSTGGGFRLSDQRAYFKMACAIRAYVDLAPIEQLDDTDYVAAVSCVGASSLSSMGVAKLLRDGFELLRGSVGYLPAAVFPVEVNVEGLAFYMAASANIPVLDADSCGGRAVPQVQFDNCELHQRSPLPMVMLTLDGDALTLHHTASIDRAESIARWYSRTSSGLVALIDHAMPVREAKQILSLGTIGRSLALGELLENQDLEGCDAFLMRLGGASLGTGVVCQCEFALNAEAGFLTGYYEIEEPSGRKLRVIVKNENLVCLERDQVVLTCPDLILALDLEKMEGVHNSEMRTGQQVRLYSLPAEKRWQTSKARCIGGPRSAGLDFPSVCIPETE